MTFSNADKMCSCASLVDPLCWEHVCEWSPNASSTKRVQFHTSQDVPPSDGTLAPDGRTTERKVKRENKATEKTFWRNAKIGEFSNTN